MDKSCFSDVNLSAIKTYIPIWGKAIPGNSAKSKLTTMKIGEKASDMEMLMAAAYSMPGTTIKNPDEIKSRLDTFQYYHEIATGFRPSTFEDIPCIDYYPCHGSDKAVLVIPGGGYTYQANSGVAPKEQYEGGAMAIKLNEAGWSAFVLSRYRLNPYHFPIPLLDAQRAMRYIRFHADEFSLNPDKLGIMGFSAGGYQSAATIHFTRSRTVADILSECGASDVMYEEDEVDKTECKAAFGGLIYPMLSFTSNLPIMYSVFDEEAVNNTTAREKLIERYNIINSVQNGDAPIFLCMGTNDTMVNLSGENNLYVEKLESMGIKHHVLPVKGANHGFGACINGDARQYAYWVNEFIDWINNLDSIKQQSPEA